MTQVRILSLGFTVPEHRVAQSEALRYFGWSSPLSQRIFRNSWVDYRHTWVPPEMIQQGFSWQDATGLYKRGAINLAVKAARDALDQYPIERVGQLTFVSVTGYECPALSYAVATELGLRRDVVHSNILGQGCEAALPGLERSCDYVQAHPDRLALTIAAEICSATWFPAAESDLEYVVASAIFADGASAALLGASEDPAYPQVVDFESYFDPAHLDLLGYRWVEGRLKVLLSNRVPEVVPPLLRETADILLRRNGLSRQDVRYWILHPGGRSVLENLQRELGLTVEQTYWSWEVMRRYGNMSSATLGAIAKHLYQHQKPMHGWGLACTMGAGTAVNATLLRWI